MVQRLASATKARSCAKASSGDWRTAEAIAKPAPDKDALPPDIAALLGAGIADSVMIAAASDAVTLPTGKPRAISPPSDALVPLSPGRILLPAVKLLFTPGAISHNVTARPLASLGGTIRSFVTEVGQVIAHNLARWTARIGLHLPARWPWSLGYSVAVARLRLAGACEDIGHGPSMASRRT